MTSFRSKNKSKAQAQHRRKSSHRNRLARAVAAGGLGLFAAWVAFSNPLAGTVRSAEPVPAPDITLTTQQGDYRLSEHKGETVALFFAFVA